MNYSEFEKNEEAFYAFLRQLNRKREIEVIYYEYTGQNRMYDIAFIGYETNSEGLHGIHYNKQRFTYQFGTREIDRKSRLNVLTEPQIKKIPAYLKEVFLEVARKKIDVIIKRGKKGNDDLNDLI